MQVTFHVLTQISKAQSILLVGWAAGVSLGDVWGGIIVGFTGGCGGVPATPGRCSIILGGLTLAVPAWNIATWCASASSFLRASASPFAFSNSTSRSLTLGN